MTSTDALALTGPTVFWSWSVPVAVAVLTLSAVIVAVQVIETGSESAASISMTRSQPGAFGSETVTLVSGASPVFVTTTVQVTCVPDRTTGLSTDFVIDRPGAITSTTALALLGVTAVSCGSFAVTVAVLVVS